MISIDSSEVFIHIINFLVLICALNMLLYRPIRQILIKRKEKTISLDHGIKTLLKDAEEKSLFHEMELKEARSHGVKEKERLLQVAAEEEKSIIDQINLKNQENFAKIQVKITEDVEAAKAVLIKEVDSFAEIISRKILGRSVS